MMAQPHQFKLGQAVDLRSREMNLKPQGRFEIVRVMPTEHGQRQYRIRSLLDGHERMVMESELAQ